MTQDMEQKLEVIAETTNLIAWKGEDADGEVCYHIEIGNTMLTFYTEEWIEMLDLLKQITQQADKEK
jgi:hypothetical protein